MPRIFADRPFRPTAPRAPLKAQRTERWAVPVDADVGSDEVPAQDSHQDERIRSSIEAAHWSLLLT